MRWVGESALISCGMGFLQRLQFAQQAIVFGIRDLRIVEHIIAVVMKTDLLAELFYALCRLRFYSHLVPIIRMQPCGEDDLQQCFLAPA